LQQSVAVRPTQSKADLQRRPAPVLGNVLHTALPLWVQAVWKRFSSPKNCTQPGAMGLDATV